MLKILVLEADPAAFIEFRDVLREADARAGKPHAFAERAPDVSTAGSMLKIERYDVVVIRDDLTRDALNFLLTLMNSKVVARMLLLQDCRSVRMPPEALNLLSGGFAQMLDRNTVSSAALARSLYADRAVSGKLSGALQA